MPYFIYIINFVKWYSGNKNRLLSQLFLPRFIPIAGLPGENRIGQRFDKCAKAVGGLVLIFIGLCVVLTYILVWLPCWPLAVALPSTPISGSPTFHPSFKHFRRARGMTK